MALFLVGLILPSVGLVFRWHVMTGQEEYRQLASFPHLALTRDSLAAFPQKFSAYFNDHFGFRSTLIHLQALTKMKAFGVSPHPNVMVGQEGCLFFRREYSETGRRLIPAYTTEQLEAWRKLLEARRDWLEHRGIKYLFVIVPRKDAVYPELMGPQFQPSEASRFDQFVSYMRDHSTVKILDLRTPLIAAKPRRRLYAIYDQHWNFDGALVGYQAIIDDLRHSFPNITAVSEADCNVTIERAAGDMARAIGLGSYLREDMRVLRIRQPHFKIVHDLNLFRIGESMITEVNNPALPRTVMFGDSNFMALRTFMPESFSRFVFKWQVPLDPETITAERPDVVIQEMGEILLADESVLDMRELQTLAEPPIQNRER